MKLQKIPKLFYNTSSLFYFNDINCSFNSSHNDKVLIVISEKVKSQRCCLEFHFRHYFFVLQNFDFVRPWKCNSNVFLCWLMCKRCSKSVWIAITWLFYVKSLNEFTWLKIPQLQNIIVFVISCQNGSIFIIQWICWNGWTVDFSNRLRFHSDIPNLDRGIPSSTEKYVFILRKAFDTKNSVIMMVWRQLISSSMNINLK